MFGTQDRRDDRTQQTEQQQSACQWHGRSADSERKRHDRGDLDPQTRTPRSALPADDAEQPRRREPARRDPKTLPASRFRLVARRASHWRRMPSGRRRRSPRGRVRNIASPWRKRLEDLHVPCRFSMRPETTPTPASVTATPTCNESRGTVQYPCDPYIRFNIRKYVHQGLTHDRSSLSGDDPHDYRCPAAVGRAAAGGVTR